MKTGKDILKKSFWKSRIFWSFLPLLLMVFICGCVNPEKEEQPSSDRDPILRVGLSEGVPHLLSVEKNNNLTGLEIELLNLFAKEKGYLLETTVYEKEELLFALRRGEIDIAVPCDTDTYISANFLSPCAPHFKTGQRVVVKDSVSMFIKDSSQLNSDEVIVFTVAGSVSSDFAKKLFPKAELISLKDIESCLKRSQEEDGAIVLVTSSEAWVLKTSGYYIRTSENKKNRIKFVPVLTPLTDEVICWAVRRSNTEWKKYLDKFMAEKKKDGSLQELTEKHGVDVINQ